VHNRAAAFAGVLSDSRVDRDAVAVLERKLNVEALVRIFGGVFRHGGAERIGVAAKVRVVVAKLRPT
jgi:hypothetical protein